ncbi:Nuclear GTPase SLIP-GC [Balamuthia mandrillaris]
MLAFASGLEIIQAMECSNQGPQHSQNRDARGDMERLLAYVEEKIRLPLEQRYNAICDTDVYQSSESQEEEEQNGSEEWKLVKLYLQEILLHAKEAQGRRIGFYGERGAGKSSLINAVLQLDTPLLPTSATSTCTAAVSEITSWDRDLFQARVFFISQLDWEHEVEVAKDLLGKNKNEERKMKKEEEEDEEEEEEEEEEVNEQLEAFLERIRTLSGDSDDWTLKPEQQALLGKSRKIETRTARELAESLSPFIDETSDSKLWPLVDRIYIRGPFPALQGLEVSLLDIPGVHDGNVAMKRRCEAALDSCDSVFYMPPLQKANTNSTVQALGKLALIPRVGIVIARLREFLESEKRTSAEKAAAVMKQRIMGRSGGKLKEDFPLYFVETRAATPDMKQNLEQFIATEMRDITTNDIAMHVCQLQNDLNNLISIFREAMLHSRKTDKAQELLLEAENKMANPTWSPEIGASSKLWRVVTLPKAKSIVRQFEKIAWNTARSRIRQGELFEPFNTRKLSEIQWRDLDDADWVRMSLKELLGEFGREVEVKNILDSWQEKLERSRARVLRHHKTKLQEYLLLDLRNLYETQKLWYDIKDRKGRGLLRFMLSQLETQLAGIFSSYRECVPDTLRNWRHEALSELAESTQALFHRLMTILRPLCVSAPHEHNTVKFFEDLLQPINICQPVQWDGGEEHGFEEESPMLYSLSNIHELDSTLTPLPRAKVKLYANPNNYLQTGYVYVASNPGYQHDYFKIGLTGRALNKRVQELRTTGVPQRFEIKRHWRTNHTKIFEHIMHKLFSSMRVTKDREFFQTDLELIKKVGDQLQRILDGGRLLLKEEKEEEEEEEEIKRPRKRRQIDKQLC